MVICYTAKKTHVHDYGDLFSCGSISRDSGTRNGSQKAGCMECVWADADLASRVVVEPTFLVTAFLFLAFPK